ncbi:MAG: hypothetical protein JRJ39_10595 [Deltaproteobacteria bacterium]|nr:hypothetical protein [Deltaproteobacteria bacterium]
MFYLVSITVFTSVVLILVCILLFIEAKVVTKGDCRISINHDEKNVSISYGNTLLSGLAGNSIYLSFAA